MLASRVGGELAVDFDVVAADIELALGLHGVAAGVAPLQLAGQRHVGHAAVGERDTRFAAQPGQPLHQHALVGGAARAHAVGDGELGVALQVEAVRAGAPAAPRAGGEPRLGVEVDERGAGLELPRVTAALGGALEFGAGAIGAGPQLAQLDALFGAGGVELELHRAWWVDELPAEVGQRGEARRRGRAGGRARGEGARQLDRSAQGHRHQAVVERAWLHFRERGVDGEVAPLPARGALQRAGGALLVEELGLEALQAQLVGLVAAPAGVGHEAAHGQLLPVPAAGSGVFQVGREGERVGWAAAFRRDAQRAVERGERRLRQQRREVEALRLGVEPRECPAGFGLYLCTRIERLALCAQLRAQLELRERPGRLRFGLPVGAQGLGPGRQRGLALCALGGLEGDVHRHRAQRVDACVAGEVQRVEAGTQRLEAVGAAPVMAQVHAAAHVAQRVAAAEAWHLQLAGLHVVDLQLDRQVQVARQREGRALAARLHRDDHPLGHERGHVDAGPHALRVGVVEAQRAPRRPVDHDARVAHGDDDLLCLEIAA